MDFEYAKVTDYLKQYLLKGLKSLENVSQHNDPQNMNEVSDIFEKPLEEVLKISEQQQYEGIVLHGIYWILAALDLLRGNEKLSLEIFRFIESVKHSIYRLVQSCWIQELGGYRSSPSSVEPDTLLATMYAIQSLSLLGLLHTIDLQAVMVYVLSLQDEKTATFKLSRQANWTEAELDLRAVLCALVCLFHLTNAGDAASSRLSYLPPSKVDSLVQWILACQNDDGGFGCSPGNESHAGYTYCAIASLATLNKLHMLIKDSVRLSSVFWFLECRQIFLEHPYGALVCNGRAGKPPDVCYSWWVLASLEILHCHIIPYNNHDIPLLSCSPCLPLFPFFFTSWEIKKAYHVKGILQFVQDDGGFSRALTPPLCSNSLAFFFPESLSNPSKFSVATSDIYHTFFALASLALLSSGRQRFLCLNGINLISAFPLNAHDHLSTPQ